ncbi:hypothetical protein HWV62_14620 [Athelia sp. TMB]|nr:hypothetical protein HWV62_14620 [Athelia sp. TMB]
MSAPFPPMATPTLPMATARTPPASADTWKYAHNLKVLRRRDPSIAAIFDQFSHVCVYTHDGARWTKQGVEGSMFLFERDAYPPYGLYILNRTGTADFIQPVLPELSLQAHEKYLLLRSYPAFTAGRMGRLPPPGPGSKFDPTYAVPGVERLTDGQKGEGVTIGLWCFATDARESMQDVVMRLHSYVQRNEPYPDEYKYLPNQPPPTHRASPSLDALFSKLSPSPAPSQAQTQAPRGQALLDSIFASASTPSAPANYEGDNEDSSPAPSPAPVPAHAHSQSHTTFSQTTHTTTTTTQTQIHAGHTPAQERTPRATAPQLIDEDALDLLPPAPRKRNRRKDKDKAKGVVSPTAPLSPAPVAAPTPAPAAPAPAPKATGGVAFSPAPDPFAANAEEVVPELDFGDADAMASLLVAPAKSGRKKGRREKAAAGAEATGPPTQVQPGVQVLARPAPPAQPAAPPAQPPQPARASQPAQPSQPPQQRAQQTQPQAPEGPLDPARARAAILTSLPPSLPAGLGRNDFVREVLTLIHRDKSFVDTLWGNYTSR